MLHEISQADRLHFSLAKLIDSFINIEEVEMKNMYLCSHFCMFDYQVFILFHS